MKKTFTLICSVFILWACEKDKDPVPALAGEYQAGEMVPNTLLMYTSSGKIKDAQVIGEFVERRQRDYGFGLYFPLNDNLIAINFKEGSSAELITKNGSTETEIREYSDSRLLLTSVDTLTNIGEPLPDSRCTQLGKDILLVRPPKVCTPLPASTGFSEVCSYPSVYPVNIKNGQLSMPVLSLIIYSSTQETRCSLGISNIWNLFNEEITNQMIEGDTIVVWSGELPLTKK